MPSDLYRFADGPAPPATLRVDGRTVELTLGRHPLPPSPGGRAGEVVVADGFARVRRTWRAEADGDDGVELTLPMPARRVAAHPSVQADTGRLALQRGPVVYAVEGVDHGGSLAGLRLQVAGQIATEWRPDLLGGVVTLVAPSQRSDDPTGRLLAVPYFAWANRGAGEMAVWLPADAGAHGR